MGQWNITIRGLGIHHNKMEENDANRMAARFVQDLKDAGHQIAAATITAGFEDDISDPENYLTDRNAIEGPTPVEAPPPEGVVEEPPPDAEEEPPPPESVPGEPPPAPPPTQE